MAPIVENGAGMASHLPVRLFPLGRRPCLQQIPKTFYLDKIHPPIQESPAGELPWFRRADARRSGKRRNHRNNNGMAAMQVKLGDILACRRMRPWKPQHQSLIEEIASFRIGDGAQ